MSFRGGPSRGDFLTSKQIAIMTAICRKNTDDTWLDMDQLVEVLAMSASKQALQCSIRFLEKKGLVERLPLELRRGAMRRPVAATAAGQGMFAQRPEQPLPVRLEDVLLDADAPDLTADLLSATMIARYLTPKAPAGRIGKLGK